MIVRNVTYQQLEEALNATNEQFRGNVRWNRSPEKVNQACTAFRLTLRVASSGSAGHRISVAYSGSRRLIAACWHVHRAFMSALPPNATVQSTFGKWTHGDEYADRDIGSIMYPCMASEACEC